MANKIDYYRWMKGPYFIKQSRVGLDPKLKYPVIMKPAICTGLGKNVAKIHNNEEAKEYLDRFKNTREKIIVQDYYPAQYEAGVLYERYPWEKRGRIISAVQKKLKNKTNEFQPRSCGRGICLDMTDQWLTPLNRQILIDEIERIPDINACRLDLLFDSIEDFKQGQGFKIVEVNGRCGQDLRCVKYYPKYTPSYLCFFTSHTSRRILMGLGNILRGRGFNAIELIRILPTKMRMAYQEGDLNCLVNQDF